MPTMKAIYGAIWRDVGVPIHPTESTPGGCGRQKPTGRRATKWSPNRCKIFCTTLRRPTKLRSTLWPRPSSPRELPRFQVGNTCLVFGMFHLVCVSSWWSNVDFLSVQLNKSLPVNMYRLFMTLLFSFLSLYRDGWAPYPEEKSGEPWMSQVSRPI